MPKSLTHLSERACCLACGYALKGLARPVCPECGRAFDPANPTTYGITPPAAEKLVSGRWVVMVLIGSLVALFFWVVMFVVVF